MLLQYSENKRDMQIKRQMFSIINRKCYLCIENRKGCQNNILITKSNNQLAQCNFSNYCRTEKDHVHRRTERLHQNIYGRRSQTYPVTDEYESHGRALAIQSFHTCAPLLHRTER